MRDDGRFIPGGHRTREMHVLAAFLLCRASPKAVQSKKRKEGLRHESGAKEERETKIAPSMLVVLLYLHHRLVRTAIVVVSFTSCICESETR